MAYFAGLDVSLKETSVCIVDDAAAVDRMRSRLDTPIAAGSNVRHPIVRAIECEVAHTRSGLRAIV
jgi:hypothetical protein